MYCTSLLLFSHLSTSSEILQRHLQILLCFGCGASISEGPNDSRPISCIVFNGSSISPDRMSCPIPQVAHQCCVHCMVLTGNRHRETACDAQGCRTVCRHKVGTRGSRHDTAGFTARAGDKYNRTGRTTALFVDDGGRKSASSLRRGTIRLQRISARRVWPQRGISWPAASDAMKLRGWDMLRFAGDAVCFGVEDGWSGRHDAVRARFSGWGRRCALVWQCKPRSMRT